MDIIKLMYEYPKIDKKIEEYCKELECIAELQEISRNALKAAKLTAMPMGQGTTSDSTFECVSKIIDRYAADAEKVLEKIYMWNRRKRRINDVLRELTDDECSFVGLYFYQNMPMTGIAYTMKYNYDHARRMKKALLGRIREIDKGEIGAIA